MIKILKPGAFFLAIVLLQMSAQLSYAFEPYSTRELDELEKEFTQQINESSQIERDPLANQYIHQLGKKLAQSGNIANSSFFIVKSNEINAFAGPGGHIGINTQLILSSDNESELAAVMAHELAHVRLHHLYRMIEHQKQMRIPMLASILASIALGVINPIAGNGALMASLSGFSQDNINFTRAKEKEADRIGIKMLIHAGFNPRAMANFFKKLQQNSRYYYTANVPAILRTHPLDDERIAEADNRSLHLTDKSYPNTLEYQLVKELIRINVFRGNKRLLDYYINSCRQGVACQYGLAMAYLSLHQLDSAEEKLRLLLTTDKNNLFFQIAMSELEISRKRYEAANARLRELHNNYPENYAVLITYARALIIAGQAKEAVSLLLRGQRQFKTDIAICETLAKAYSQTDKKAYAYFTESQCELLQGRRKSAMRQLKLAKELAKQDPYLLARTMAMMEEIVFLESD